jgi:hypothetical protein
MAAECFFTVDNVDKDWYPDDTGSPYYPSVIPGRLVRVQSEDATNIFRTMFWGRIDNIEYSPRFSERTADISCMGGLADLQGVNVTTLVYEGKDTGYLINRILDKINYPHWNRDIETGITVLPFWWADETDAFEAISQLVLAEGPNARVDVLDGTFTFRNRHHRLLTTASAVSQSTWRGTHGETEPVFSDMQIDYGWRDIVNDITIPVTLRRKAELQVVWKHDGLVTVPPSASIEVGHIPGQPITGPQPGNVTGIGATVRIGDVEVQVGEAFTDLVNPVANIDYEVVQGSVFAIGVNETSGGSARLTVIAGTAGVVLKNLQIRGRPIINLGNANATARNDASILTYNRRSLNLDVPWISLNEAEAMADELIAKYKDPVRKFHCTFRGGGTGVGSINARLEQQTLRTLDDRVTIDDSETLFDGDTWIDTIHHEILAGGLFWETTFSCEQVAGTALGANLILDSATAGILNTNTLGY